MCLLVESLEADNLDPYPEDSQIGSHIDRRVRDNPIMPETDRILLPIVHEASDYPGTCQPDGSSPLHTLTREDHPFVQSLPASLPPLRILSYEEVRPNPCENVIRKSHLDTEEGIGE